MPLLTLADTTQANKMPRSQPSKPPHSKQYFSSFVGFTNSVTGTVTCRGYCTWWPRVGKRCALPRSRKAKAAIDRILLAALNINYCGDELQIVVEDELENICCQHHRAMEVVDEVCFLIGAYRVNVLGWAWEQGTGVVTLADGEIMGTEDTLLLEELIVEAELIAELEVCLALEKTVKTIDAETALHGGADDTSSSAQADHASSSDGDLDEDGEHLISSADVPTTNESESAVTIAIDWSEFRLSCSVKGSESPAPST